MIFREIKQDLFTVPLDYALVHCISADFALGAGIAAKFQEKYQTRDELKSKRLNYTFVSGDCIRTGSEDSRIVFNLITKPHYWNKPTYTTLYEALCVLKTAVLMRGYSKLAMPRIGCGLDKLNWIEVSKMIKMIFSDIENLEILVCTLE